MKRHTLLLALGAAFLTAFSAVGQTSKKADKAAPAAPPPAAQPNPQQKLARVATLNGIDVNREFQNNVQMLQAQRQAAIELNDAMEKEKDPKKKAELKAQVDQIMAKLNENNQTMQKAYGFSLARNYTMVIETSHIYMFVSDDEAAKIEAAEKAQQSAQKSQPAQKAKSGKK
jgi:hypothetical protein